MKHRDWLRLHTVGEKLCAVLRQQGYECQKQIRRLSWKVSKEGDTYVLTYIPAPVQSWTVLPNNDNPAREQLMSVVQNALNTDEFGTLNVNQRIQYPEVSTRPWTIVRLLPNARSYTIARFCNRQNAQDYKRTLNRFIPTAEFEIVFDPEDRS